MQIPSAKFQDTFEKPTTSPSMESMLQRLMTLPPSTESDRHSSSGLAESAMTLGINDQNLTSQWRPSGSTWGPLAEIWKVKSSNLIVDSLLNNNVGFYSSRALRSSSDQEFLVSDAEFPKENKACLNHQTKMVISSKDSQLNSLALLKSSSLGDWALIIIGLVLWGLAAFIVIDGPGFLDKILVSVKYF